MIDASIPLQVRPQQPINPLADVAQIMQLKQAQALLPLKIQEAQQNQQESAMRLQEMQRQINDRKALDAAYAGAVTNDPTTGLPSFDRTKLTQTLVQGGQGHQVPALLESLDKVDQSRATLTEAQQKIAAANAEHGAGIGLAVKQSGYDPAFLRSQLAIELANKTTQPQIVQSLTQQLDAADQQDPTGAASKALTQKIADTLMAQGGPAFQTAQARATQAATGAAKLPSEIKRNEAETTVAQQRAAGTVPITPYQQAELDKGGAERNPTEASLAMTVAAGKVPGATVDQVNASKQAEIALKRLDQSKIQSRPVTNVTLASPAEQQTAARMLTEGRIDPQTARSMIRRQPALLAQAQAIDPNFDEADLDKRYNTLKEFTNTSNTKAGGQALALNTLIHHADLYQQVGDSLKNGTFVPGNAAYNAVASMFGSAPPQNANLVARFLAGETGKVATGGVPAEGEINGILQSLNKNASPEQIKEAGQKMLEIASGRAIPLMERVHDAKLDNTIQVIGPDAKAILQRRGIDPNTLRPVGGNNKPPANAPAVGTIKGGYRFKGGNPADEKNWEKQ